MNNPKKIVKDVSQKVFSAMIKHDITGWPPDCMMFTYQPVRPVCQENISAENKSDEKKCIGKP